MDEHRLDALALRCWPEIPNAFGVWPYLAFGGSARRAGSSRWKATSTGR